MTSGAATTDKSTTGQGRGALLRPFVLGYAVNPVALALLWALRRWHLVAPVHVWVYFVVLWGTALVGTASELWFRHRPSRTSLHLRVLVQVAGVTVTLYVTGWGPVIAIAYAFMAQENVARSGSKTWRITAGWSVVCLGIGQLAIWRGIAPSLISEPLVHGLAALEAAAVVMVVRMAGAVTDQKERAEARLRASEERFRSLVQNSSDLTLVMDTTGEITYASEASVGLLGRTPEELIGEQAADLVHPDDISWLQVQLSAELRVMTTAQPLELRVRHSDGTWRDVEAVVADLLDRPSVAGIVVNARDLTERKRVEAALEHQALHDALTGLPNRMLFLDRLEQAIARAGREHATPAVMFLDLDRFKLVNDGLGHDVGDELLIGVAARLRGTLRPGDTVARFGGDEFVLLFEGLSTAESADVLAGRILACFATPFLVGGEEFQASASLGMALGDGAKTAGELVRDADAAMYRAKALGRGRLQVFDTATHDESLLRMHTETALRGALARGELRLHYQPIFELVEGRPVGVEALVRWEHPTRGLLGPDAFIAVAEDSGLIVPIGAWVLREACRQVRAWNEVRDPAHPLRLSVNLSARQLAEPTLVATVRDTLLGAGIDPGRLHLSLEITEALVLHDPETAALRLGELRALGVQFAIDDFGTGYSSMAYLRRFPVSIVKVDSPFVAGLGIDDHDEAIVSAIVRLAHTLGLRVVAEGVETELQLVHLRAMGCDYAQGYLLGRPELPERVDLLGGDAFAEQTRDSSPPRV